MEMTLGLKSKREENELTKWIKEDFLSADEQEWVYDNLEDGMTLDEVRALYFKISESWDGDRYDESEEA